MLSSSHEKYLVDPDKVQIPDEGMGEYIVGYSGEKTPFNFLHLAWLLIPYIGIAFFLYFLLKYFLDASRTTRLLLYRNGFIKQNMSFNGKVKNQTVCNFDHVEGFMIHRTRHYTDTYGFRNYVETKIKLTLLDDDHFEEVVLKGKYKNEQEEEGRYDLTGHFCNALNNVWIPFAIQRFNRDLSTKGYGTFYTPYGEVQVGRDYIRVYHTVVTAGFKYSFYDGNLHLFPTATEAAGHFKSNAEDITVNIAEMYNKEVFLMAVDQLLGIK